MEQLHLSSMSTLEFKGLLILSLLTAPSTSLIFVMWFEAWTLDMHEPLEINVEKHHENKLNNQIWQLELCMCKNENQKSIPVPAQN